MCYAKKGTFNMKERVLIFSIIATVMLSGCGGKSIENNTLDNTSIETTQTVSASQTETEQTTQKKVITGISSELEKSQEVQVGATVQLSCTLSPEKADSQYKNVIWSSTDQTIATVDQNGTVTGVSNGICTIVATSENNPDITFKYTITVSGGSNKVTKATTIYISTSEFTTTTTTTPPTLATTTAPPNTAPPQDIVNTTTVPESESEVVTTTTTTVTAQPTYINNILLVNSEHPLPADYVPDSSQVSGSYGLLSYVQQAFDTMSTDATAEGISLYINKGYVSYLDQEAIFEDAFFRYSDQSYVTHYYDEAGYSDSQTGLSILLNSADNTFDDTAEAQWIANNCYKYGFIVRYPQGKEGSTNHQYRSYQIRYVGVDVATAMHQGSLSLEEYLGV